MRAVPHFVASPLESAWELDVDHCFGAALEEGFGSFSGASEDELRIRWDQVLECVVRCDNYSCRVRYCQFFLRDLLRRLAEHFGVLERDVRELDDRRVDNVRDVEASPKPSLDDGHVHPSFGELGQGGRRQDLELRGSERFRGTANPRDGPLEARRITIQPLVPARDVGRRVGACT